MMYEAHPPILVYNDATAKPYSHTYSPASTPFGAIFFPAIRGTQKKIKLMSTQQGDVWRREQKEKNTPLKSTRRYLTTRATQSFTKRRIPRNE